MSYPESFLPSEGEEVDSRVRVFTSVLSLLTPGKGMAWYVGSKQNEVYWSDPCATFLGHDAQSITPSLDALWLFDGPAPRDTQSLQRPTVSFLPVGPDGFVDRELRRRDGRRLPARVLQFTSQELRSGSISAVGLVRLLGDETSPTMPNGAPQRDRQGAEGLRSPAYPALFATFDTGGRLLAANGLARHAVGGSADDLPVLGWAGYLSRTMRTEVEVSDAVLMIEGDQLDEIIVGRAGAWWRISSLPLYATQGLKPPRKLVILQDITLLLENLERVALHERQLMRTLVREVHHRIKNHLQGLVGLLRVAGSTARSPAEVLNSAMAHAETIAALHGVLGRDGRSVLPLYRLLEELVRQANHQAKVPVGLSVEVACEEFRVVDEDMIPIGLVLNEMVTNAIKHTKPSPGAVVTARLRMEGPCAAVEVRNSPARLVAAPPTSDEAPRGYSGLTLARMLLPQPRCRFELVQESVDTVVSRLVVMPAAADAAPAVSGVN